MNIQKIEAFKREFQLKTDEELLKIWTENNVMEYSLFGFEAIRRILEERNIEIPEQIPFDLVRMEQIQKMSSGKKSSSKPFPFYMIGVCIFATWVLFAPFIKDILIQNPSYIGDYGTEELIRAGSKRVFLDFIVFFVSAFFGVISGVQYLFGKSSS